MHRPAPPTHIEISRSAIKHNIDFLKQMVGDDVLFTSVVKGNAYGHGIEAFCPIAMESGVDHFCTYSADEAFRLWEATEGKASIIVMGYKSFQALEWMIENEIQFFVFEKSYLEEAKRVAQKVGRPAKVHLEIETGMNRTGIEIEELDQVLNFIKANTEFIQLEGICTHFAGAESISNYYRVQNQSKRFSKVVNRLKREKSLPPKVHAACSAASLRLPKSRYNMVRIGIMQYGFFPSNESWVEYASQHHDLEFPLKRVISWKSKVMSIKEVGTGEFIGYGTSYFTNSPTRIAIVPVGYGLGFDRDLSNQGKVIIGGQRVNVIGIVNMNALTVDISGMDNVELGDEVVLIGKQGDSEITVASFSDISRLMNYELLTRLPSEIPRLVVD
jgi:alanine racemase